MSTATSYFTYGVILARFVNGLGDEALIEDPHGFQLAYLEPYQVKVLKQTQG
jgi:hypothetical protein